MRKKHKYLYIVLFIFAIFVTQIFAKNVTTVYAQGVLPIPRAEFVVDTAETPEEVVSSLKLLFVIAIISLSPFLLLMLTGFTRIVILMHFIRSALGTQQMPPNQVLIGLSLSLTMFISAPDLITINETALKPFAANQITQEQAIENGMKPIREFMLRQVEVKDVNIFAALAGETYEDIEDMKENMSNRVLIPSFLIGEITKGFRYGVLIYMPFIVIDMVVSSTLMAMGMMMLPPAMIALPFKILLFVMVDGWNLVIDSLMATFK